MNQTADNTEHRPGTRERLLDTAERLFAERGFAGTSVRDITDTAGANLGAVNYYFQSKENLYLQVFRRRSAYQRDLLAGFRNPTALPECGFEGLLASFGRAFMASHTDPAHRHFIDLCSRELTEAQLPPGEFVREFVTPLVETIVGLVRLGRPNLDAVTARSCAHSFFAQLIHVARGAQVAKKRSDLPPMDERLTFVARFTAAAIRHIQ